MYIWSIMWLIFKFDAVFIKQDKDSFLLQLLPSAEITITPKFMGFRSYMLVLKWLNLGFAITINFSYITDKIKLYNIIPGVSLEIIN